MNEIPIGQLRELLSCDFNAGTLRWKERSVEMFVDGKHSREHTAACWNKKWAGKFAFTSNRHGYRGGSIFNKKFSAHRVIFALFHGYWPSGEIDHIDGNPMNNSITNLRDASIVENRRNAKMPTHNTSGVMGVHRHTVNEKWIAQIRVNSRGHHLGSFNNIEDAIAARKEAERRYGFHENHGRKIS